MNAIHRRKHKSNAHVLSDHAGPSTAIPVPNRYSSAICTYWTDLDKIPPSKVSPEDGSTRDDSPYLRSLKQLSATHRPSLDNLPLDRPTTVNTSDPVPSSPKPAAGNQTGKQPRVIGRRYHPRPDGGVDVEFVDVSAHYRQQQQQGRSSVNKVRPAAGVLPFNTTAAPRADNGEAGQSAVAAGVVAPASTVVAVCPKHEDREARRSRWFGWHSARMRRVRSEYEGGDGE